MSQTALATSMAGPPGILISLGALVAMAALIIIQMMMEKNKPTLESVTLEALREHDICPSVRRLLRLPAPQTAGVAQLPQPYPVHTNIEDSKSIDN